MEKPNRDGRDEMNLAVLPIALLGRNDERDVIEYYGTFSSAGKKQEPMVWTVRGAAGLGLPSEFAERVLVALFYIGAQSEFADRRLEFTPYQILKVLGHAPNGRNYKAVENALAQLHGVTVTSDKAWIEKKKDGTQKRVTTKRGFHIIDEYYLHYTDDDEDKEADTSFIVWGSRIWRNLQAGYIRRLDVDFYYSLDLPLARRLFRFLDKVTNYKQEEPYAIDVFDLANKLGLAQCQYASQLKRPLAAAADELVQRGYLAYYDFFKIGKFVKMRFCRQRTVKQLDLFETIDETIKVFDPNASLWDAIMVISPKLAGTRLVSIENGTATVAAGHLRHWIENRLGNRILKALQSEMDEIADVRFVE